MNKPVLVGIVAALSLAVGLFVGLKQFLPDTDGPDLAKLGQLELPDVDRNLRKGTEWLGDVVVVNHWATWCAPCREEIPMLIEFQQEMSEKQVQVIGVAHDLLDAALAFGDQMGINYPSLVAIVDGNKLLKAHGNGSSGALPFTVIFDRDGNPARTKLGKISRQELNSMVKPLL